MAFSSREIDTPQIEFDGHRVRLASRTSHFAGDSHALEIRPEGGIWAELGEANFNLIGNSLFTIDTAAKRPELLSGIAPKLHIELSFQGEAREAWHQKNYVVLILDNERTALVDWAVASQPDLHIFTDQVLDSPAIHFEIPLIAPSKQPSRAMQMASNILQHSMLLDSISLWEEDHQLTFGVFSIEDKEFPAYFPNLPLEWHSYLPYAVRRDEAFSLIDYIARKADGYLKHNTGGKEQLQVILQNCNTREATAQDLQQMKGKALLLCHGILSSTEGAFQGILKNPAFMAPLYQRYGGRILAWDHYTLSKTTAQNAADLLGRLPALNGVELDVLCHSRGAGVVRNLLENPNNRTQLHNQNIAVKKSVFVAGACLGSQLADAQNTNRLFRRLNLLYWAFGGTPGGFVRAILLIIKLLATIAQKMPGVEAMDPTGSDIKTLNGYGTTCASEYRYIMANYDFRFLPAKLLEEFLWNNGVFGGQANDLVVPYEGASASNKYLPGYGGMNNALSYGTATSSQSTVMHINFFTQTNTQNVLNQLLP